MASQGNVTVEIDVDHSALDASLEKMEAAALRLLVLQLTARMDEAERHIIALTTHVRTLDNVVDEGLDEIYEAVKSISVVNVYGSQGFVQHGEPETEVWTDVRKEDFANGWDTATRQDVPEDDSWMTLAAETVEEQDARRAARADEVRSQVSMTSGQAETLKKSRRGLRAWWPRG